MGHQEREEDNTERRATGERVLTEEKLETPLAEKEWQKPIAKKRRCEAGKQFIKQPKKIARKTARYRR